MTSGYGVPRWARRRAERHRARHSDGKVVRWMAFGPQDRRKRADGTTVAAGSNVLPFLRRAPAAGPDEAAPLDATGS
ncbi:hypothetical protein FF100_27055 [Methylobacterium terricola]|uniref:Uncharacterized protein n=1 Tax=Methylobacterium terricola TaxID=2583531 RepID=A0A5C4LAE0_9HYPH|nr:hypothetical protein [Methylobacterium terricola]TNC09228.1 hypothetical protein FF100_27055 [Methylobacterium terricola]